MQYLTAGGCPATAPVLSRRGNRIETVHVDGHGCYHAVVFAQAPGIPLSLERMTDAHAYQWGRSLASLHLLSEKYTPGAAKRGSWLDALAFVSAVLQRHPGETAARHELKYLRDRLSELPAGTEHTGLIHYDFQLDNVFYIDGDATYCAIDFDDAMVHWYVMDIVAALSDVMEQDDAHARRMSAQFLGGYRSLRPLEQSWEQVFPLFRRFADLYSYARLLRCVEGMDGELQAPWADRLKEKLAGICGQIRERFRPAVELRPVDQSNWYACTELQVTDEQKHVFPVPAVYWLAESAYCGYIAMALYREDQLAGFAVYAVDPDDGSYWIMAFMIDRRFQNQGLGRCGMEELVRFIKHTHDCDKIVLGHRPENERAASLYESMGFEEVERNSREVIRELKLVRS